MIDIISSRIPPKPTPPKKSGVDPSTLIPRSHRVDETESDQEKKRQKRRKPRKPEGEVSEDAPTSNPEQHHIDNYA